MIHEQHRLNENYKQIIGNFEAMARLDKVGEVVRRVRVVMEEAIVEVGWRSEEMDLVAAVIEKCTCGFVEQNMENLS